MNWRLELVQVPVTDVDRAKTFYTEKVGFNADHDHRVNDQLSRPKLPGPKMQSCAARSAGVLGVRRAFR